MNTVEIGAEATPTQLPALHLITTGLNVESRVDVVGDAAPVFHARTWAGYRRIVLVCGLETAAAGAVLDALDALPDLPAKDLVDAAKQCAARHARSTSSLPPRAAICAVRVDKRSMQWAGDGGAAIVRLRRASTWRRASITPLLTSSYQAAGVESGDVRFGRGDEVISWAGVGIADDALAGLFRETMGRRITRSSGAGVRGCLASLRRF